MGKMEKKEKTMTNSRCISWVLLILVAFMFLAPGPVLSAFEMHVSPQQQEKTTDQQKEQEKEKPAEKQKKADDLGESMKKRMDEGESLFDIIGIPSAEDYMPTTFEIFLLWLLPLSLIIGIVLLVIIVTRRRHQQILAMIEKGILPDANAIKRHRASQFRWDVFLLLTGFILGLGGIGVSVFMMGHKGPDQWYVGIIPFLIGAALLIFYQIFYKNKKE